MPTFPQREQTNRRSNVNPLRAAVLLVGAFLFAFGVEGRSWAESRTPVAARRLSLVGAAAHAHETPSAAPGRPVLPKAGVRAPRRNWETHPALVEHKPAGTLYAVSDLHGKYDQAFKLFTGNRLMKGNVKNPRRVEWTGGNATLVVAGDIINKGHGSLEMIDMLRALQKSAEQRGGKVIVTFGNHEADFIQQPRSERSLRDGKDAKSRMGLGHEVLEHGQSPEQLAQGHDKEGRGAWLRDLPFGAVVKGRKSFYFGHSGDTVGMTREQFEAHVQKQVDHGGFGHDGILGPERTILGSESWVSTARRAQKNADAMGVDTMVMGHIPDAMNSRGHIARTKDGSLIKLDTGLGNDLGEARMLRVPAGKQPMRQLDSDGKSRRVPKYKVKKNEKEPWLERPRMPNATAAAAPAPAS